jgi:release factor glutamine methyltransferase
MMTIQHAYDEFYNSLQQIYDAGEARNIADWVIEDVTGIRKIDLVIRKDLILPPKQESVLAGFLSELLRHRPVQYVLNEAWFHGLKLYVDENVLIPRPETEELVDWVVKDVSYEMQKKRKALSVLDIGTGCGCIAIAVKKNLPDADVWAVDVSEKALEVAGKNAMLQDVAVHFKKINFLQLSERHALPSFDVIVSNPPYVPEKDKTTMHKNVVDYEPHLALFVKDHEPLVFYHAIVNFAMAHLKHHGIIFLEIYENLSEQVADLFHKNGFEQIIVRKDMQGKDRMVKIQVESYGL